MIFTTLGLRFAVISRDQKWINRVNYAIHDIYDTVQSLRLAVINKTKSGLIE